MQGEISKPALWTGRVCSGSLAFFLLLDGVMKLVKPVQVVEATLALGLAETIITPLGVILLISTLIYLVPRTAFLGAILLTGYLGGAVCIHVRNAHGAFEIGLPIIFGVLLWAGLYLRDPNIRKMIG